MADSAPKPQKLPGNTEGEESNLSLAKFSPAIDKESTTPKWLEASV